MGKILVTYASRTGCTREAAEIIGRVLSSKGETQVDVRPIQEVQTLEGYSAIVVGAAARQKRGWVSEARHWLRDHETALCCVPVAYFMTCWVLRDDTSDAQREAQGYIDLVRARTPGIAPVAVGLFPGRLDLARFSAFDRFFLKRKHAPVGDWFDAERVRQWAAGLPAKLMG